MPRDALETARWLRQRAIDETREALSATITLASEAASAARDAERAIERETERASNPDGNDALVEAFAAWLPGARHVAGQARAASERLEAEVVRRRAELAACRAALEAVESLLAERRHAELRKRLLQEQQTIDEAAARGRP